MKEICNGKNTRGGLILTLKNKIMLLVPLEELFAKGLRDIKRLLNVSLISQKHILYIIDLYKKQAE